MRNIWCPFEVVDCTHIGEIAPAARHYDVDVTYHLAAVLSATGERPPRTA